MTTGDDDVEWLAKLLGGVTSAKPEGGSWQDGIAAALREAIPPQVQDTASRLLGEAPARDLLPGGDLPAQPVIDAARQAALGAVPKEAGGFVEQGMALLKDRFRL
jgi:hypothetical protein